MDKKMIKFEFNRLGEDIKQMTMPEGTSYRDLLTTLKIDLKGLDVADRGNLQENLDVKIQEGSVIIIFKLMT